MSTLDEANAPIRAETPKTARESLLSIFLGILCSVRFGLVVLTLLGLVCLTGMLIMQQNVSGFERYYAELSSWKRELYSQLGLFDIYNAWYFNALLSILSINIILASIDRFPATWKFVSNPQSSVSTNWLKRQNPHFSVTLPGDREEIVSSINAACKRAGWRKSTVTEKNGRTVIFSESGLWNRFGAYAVHLGLLTIFLGGFLTARFGHAGQIHLSPGRSSSNISEIAFDLDQMKQADKAIPFEIYCSDIQQKLVDNDGSISSNNTIDWLTTISIKDETGTHEGIVQLNKPFDYNGYRIFHANFAQVARARNVLVRATDETGQIQDLNIKRDGLAHLSNGATVKFADFRANFACGKEVLNEETLSYPAPAAILQISSREVAAQTAYAFKTPDAENPIENKFIGGYKFQLLDFEKVSDQHILTIQRDPGSNIVYLGFAVLFGSLVGVFFFSHQRVWTIVEEVSKNDFRIVAGGHSNRNQAAFEAKFDRFENCLRSEKF